jgi:L-lactate dehydrogenase (cytochrome)
LGTPRREFGNIVGHVSGVENMSSLSSWTAQQFDPALSWNDVAWIKERWGGKLILKGIQDAEDARLAVQSGADALIVSNHGGRQLDGAQSSSHHL